MMTTTTLGFAVGRWAVNPAYEVSGCMSGHKTVFLEG
jgi:hypothetical protein